MPEQALGVLERGRRWWASGLLLPGMARLRRSEMGTSWGLLVLFDLVLGFRGLAVEGFRVSGFNGLRF